MKIIHHSTRYALFFICIISILETSSSIAIQCPKCIKVFLHKIRSHLPLGSKSNKILKPTLVSSIDEVSRNKRKSTVKNDKQNNIKKIIPDLTVLPTQDDLFDGMAKNPKKELKEGDFFEKENTLFDGVIRELSVAKYVDIGFMDVQFLVDHFSEIGEKNIKIGAWTNIYKSFLFGNDEKGKYTTNRKREVGDDVFADKDLSDFSILQKPQQSKNLHKKESVITESKDNTAQTDHSLMETRSLNRKCKSDLHLLSQRKIISEHPIKLSVPGIKVDPFVESEKIQRMALVTSTFEDERSSYQPEISRKRSNKENILTSFTVIEVNEVKNIPYAENYDVITVFRALWMNDPRSTKENLRNIWEIIDGNKRKGEECKMEKKQLVHLKITQKVRIKKKFIFESFVQKAAFEEGKSTANLWAKLLLSQIGGNLFQSIETSESFRILETSYQQLNDHNIFFVLSCIARKKYSPPVSAEFSNSESTRTSLGTSEDKANDKEQEDIEYIGHLAQGVKYVTLAAVGLITGIVSIICLPRYIGKLPFDF